MQKTTKAGCGADSVGEGAHVSVVIICLILTPSPPQHVQFPGPNDARHGRACKQYIFRSCDVCISAMRFHENLSHASAKQETKRLKGFILKRMNSHCAMYIQWYNMHHHVTNTTDNNNIKEVCVCGGGGGGEGGSY